MPISVQDGSLLYDGLVPEGVHEAELVDVRQFSNSFGERVGLVYRITSGPHAGRELMEAAVPKPRGKLAELLRGMGGGSAQELVGWRGRIAVRHEVAKGGKTYEAVTATFT